MGKKRNKKWQRRFEDAGIKNLTMQEWRDAVLITRRCKGNSFLMQNYLNERPK